MPRPVHAAAAALLCGKSWRYYRTRNSQDDGGRDMSLCLNILNMLYHATINGLLWQFILLVGYCHFGGFLILSHFDRHWETQDWLRPCCTNISPATLLRMWQNVIGASLQRRSFNFETNKLMTCSTAYTLEIDEVQKNAQEARKELSAYLNVQHG